MVYIYLRRKACPDCLKEIVEEVSKYTYPVLVMGHFPDQVDLIASALKEAGIPNVITGVLVPGTETYHALTEMRRYSAFGYPIVVITDYGRFSDIVHYHYPSAKVLILGDTYRK